MIFNPKNKLLFKVILFKIPKRLKSNLSVLFYGSNSFSIPSLKCLHSNLLLPSNNENKIIKSLDICTKSPKNDVGNYSNKHKLNLILWPYEVPFNKYDIGIVVSFGELIPKQSIDACSKGILNAHASLLPKLRGAAPVFRAVLNDCKETGVTIMCIKADKFDVGNIVLQEKVEMNEETKSIELYDKLSKISAKLLLNCLKDLDYYLERSTKQNEHEATKAFKIKPGENKINWQKMNLKYIYKLYRAFDGFFSIYTIWIDGREMKLSKMVSFNRMIEIQDQLNNEFNLKNDFEPGTIKYSKHKNIVCIKCKDYWVGFNEIILKGSKRVSAKQFNNGYLIHNKQIVLE